MAEIPSDAHVRSLYAEYRYGREVALRIGDASLLTALERIYPRTLLLASASWCENAVTRTLESLYDQPVHLPLRHFVVQRALKRRYHTLFDWDSESASGFFASFGGHVSGIAKSRLRGDKQFAGAVAAFMRIGSLRNQLVHGDFAAFALDSTAENVMQMHEQASDFPAMIAACVFAEIPE
jgi:hypothetical protein